MTAPVPIFRYRERHADDAFEVHQALLRAELNQPALEANPRWQALRKQVFDEFTEAFEAVR